MPGMADAAADERHAVGLAVKDAVVLVAPEPIIDRPGADRASASADLLEQRLGLELAETERLVLAEQDRGALRILGLAQALRQPLELKRVPELAVVRIVICGVDGDHLVAV